MYVCMYVCMYLCMYVCMYVRIYVCMGLRLATYIDRKLIARVCICLCIYVCMHAYVCVLSWPVYMHACIYIVFFLARCSQSNRSLLEPYIHTYPPVALLSFLISYLALLNGFRHLTRSNKEFIPYKDKCICIQTHMHTHMPTHTHTSNLALLLELLFGFRQILI